jgi:hypothetical protein
MLHKPIQESDLTSCIKMVGFSTQRVKIKKNDTEKNGSEAKWRILEAK